MAVKQDEIGAVVIEDRDWHGAHITGVRVSDGEIVGTRFLSGEPWWSRWTTRSSPTSPTVTLTILNEVGVLMAATDNKAELEPSGLGPGTGTARFSMEELPLQEGRFSLNISLQAENGVMYHNREKCAQFMVISQTRGYGPVRLSGGWQISTHAGA